jgi:hypothetical protein
MKIHTVLPQTLLDGWTSSQETHPAGQTVEFHYHDVEEWLEVRRGEITFFTLSDQALPLRAGAVLHIPRGEVHRAEIGPDGVEYQMYLPVAPATAFANRLAAEELALLRTNLAFPIREENTDGHAAEFFATHLSDQLAFCRADATVVGKDAFRGGFVARNRTSSGTVSVLNRTPNGILLSTVVTMGAGGPAAKSFTNIRLFVNESGAWRCKMWVNHPGV